MEPASTRPPGTKRLSVILAAFAYVVLLGLPVWWLTTSLHRPPLPHAEIAAVAADAQRSADALPLALQLVVVVPAGTELPPSLSAEQFVAAARQAVLDSGLEAPVRLSATINAAGVCSQHAADTGEGGGGRAAPCPDLSAPPVTVGGGPELRGRLDDWLAQQQPTAPGHYFLHLLPWAPTPGDPEAEGGAALQLVVGRRRHAWLPYDAARAPQAPGRLLAAAGVAVARALACCFGLHSGAAAAAAAGRLPVSAAGHTQLSFSLLNAEPAAADDDGSGGGGGAGRLSWDFGEFESRHLAPVASALAPLCRLSAESQVLHYTPARSAGAWSDELGAHVVEARQLPTFIDSEWAVESGRAVMQLGGLGAGGGARAAGRSGAGANVLESHVLHFLAYVPPPGGRPLLLLGHDGRPLAGNGFWIPSWGGMLVLNPPGGGHEPAGGEPWRPAQLQPEQYAHVASVVISQLQALFGVAAPAGGGAGGAPPELAVLPAGPAGFAEWQVDALLRQRSAFDAREAARVLGSLSRLVLQLPNLEMPDAIGEQVSQALAGVQRARVHIAAGDYHAAAASAAEARAASEAAFHHPAVLAQLNFPDSHKLGVYMPLFLPVSVPLLQGLATQVLHYARRRRQWAAAARAGA